MKKLVQILATSALVATLWLPALARNTQALAAASMAQQQGDEEAKAALYQKFLDAYKTNPKAEYGKPKEAYDIAREYLQKYPEESQQTAYLKKYVAAFEANQKAGRNSEVENLLRQQKYAEGFNAAKAILAQEPDNVAMLNNAVFAALYAKNESLIPEASNYARKAIQLIQSGQPFDKRDDTLGWLNSALGFFSLKNNPSEAINYYIKAAGFEGAAKKDPQTYMFLGDSYRAAEYTKLAADFKTRCSTAEQQATPDCKALSDRVNQVVDRMIDAYARAVALSTDPKYAALKSDAMAALTPLYKFRHENSEAGLNEFIAGILAKPLPTGPINTTAPASSTSQTGTTGATGTTVGSNATTGNTGNGTTQKSTTTTTPSSTTPANGNKPSTTTTKPATTGKTTPRRR